MRWPGDRIRHFQSKGPEIGRGNGNSIAVRSGSVSAGVTCGWSVSLPTTNFSLCCSEQLPRHVQAQPLQRHITHHIVDRLHDRHLAIVNRHLIVQFDADVLRPHGEIGRELRFGLLRADRTARSTIVRCGRGFRRALQMSRRCAGPGGTVGGRSSAMRRAAGVMRRLATATGARRSQADRPAGRSAQIRSFCAGRGVNSILSAGTMATSAGPTTSARGCGSVQAIDLLFAALRRWAVSVSSMSPVAGSISGSVIMPAGLVEIAPTSITPSGRTLSNSQPGKVDFKLKQLGAADRVIEPCIEPNFVFTHGVNVLRLDADPRFARQHAHDQRIRLPEIFEARHEIFSPQTVGQVAHLAHAVLLAPNQLPIARHGHGQIAPLPMWNRFDDREPRQFERFAGLGDIVGPLGRKPHVDRPGGLVVELHFDHPIRSSRCRP